MEDDAEERGQGRGKNLENGNEMGWDGICVALFFFSCAREKIGMAKV